MVKAFLGTKPADGFTSLMQGTPTVGYSAGDLAHVSPRRGGQERERTHSLLASHGGLYAVRRLAAAILRMNGDGDHLAIELSAKAIPGTLNAYSQIDKEDALLTLADAEHDAAPRALPKLRSLFSAKLPNLRFFAAVPIIGEEDANGLPTRLGSLYVADAYTARTLDTAQEDALIALGRQVGAILSLESHKRRLEAETVRLSALATTDGLTGLANRRSFSDRLNAAISYARQTETPLSLIMMDVDRFKTYNDMFGHPAGDEVLRQVGRILTRVARDSDIPARYGGEEFAVLMPETDGETGSIIADLFRGEIEASAFPHREITASLGVAELTLFMQPGDLVSAADAALYKSKTNGRNQVTLAEP